MMGIIGSASGVFFGTVVNIIISIVGIDFSKMMSSMTLPMDNIVYTRPDLFSTLQMFCIGIIVSGLVALLPSRQAARMNTVDAIKSV